MATMVKVTVTQEESEPEEKNEKEARVEVPKPEALESPAPRTEVRTGKRILRTHVCVEMGLLSFKLTSEISPGLWSRFFLREAFKFDNITTI